MLAIRCCDRFPPFRHADGGKDESYASAGPDDAALPRRIGTTLLGGGATRPIMINPARFRVGTVEGDPGSHVQLTYYTDGGEDESC